MMRRLADLPIRTLLPLLVLIAALPTVAIIISTAVQQHRTAVSEAESRATRLVGNLAENERQLMEETSLMLGTLAETTEVRHLDQTACTRIFTRLLERNPSYASLQEISADGRLFASAQPLPADRYRGNRKYFRDALRTRQFSVGEFINDRSDVKPMLNYAQPVLAPDGSVVAVLQAGIDLERLGNRFAQVPLPDGASVVVTDYAGTIIYRSFPRGHSVGAHDDPALFGLMKSLGESGVLPGIAGETDHQLRVFGKIRLSGGTEPHMYIRVTIPEEQIYGEPRRALIRNLLLMLLVGGASLALSRLIGTALIAEPLERMVEVSAALKTGNLVVRSELPHGRNEIGNLAQAFDEMTRSVAARENERDRAQDDLLRTNDALKKSNRELQHFAYLTSHDLREPLRTITSFIQLLKKRYSGKLDRDADDFIGFIVDGADRMQQLIDDLLRYARVDSKGKPPEPVDSNEPLKLALANMGTTLAETGTSVLSESLPVILGDKVQLIQLFQNLIGNAVKFKKESPPVIEVSCSEEGEFWRFTVKDNGIGIDPTDFERIFDVFTKLHSREQYEGTGIGLAICKKIVERHGGSIGVASTPGMGAAFHFTLRKVPS